MHWDQYVLHGISPWNMVFTLCVAFVASYFVRMLIRRDGEQTIKAANADVIRRLVKLDGMVQMLVDRMEGLERRQTELSVRVRQVEMGRRPDVPPGG